MQTKDFALYVKDVSEDGTFEGHVSVSGNVDSYGDVVQPGAFATSLAKHRREGTKPLLLWQHNPDEPIGVWEDLAEDGKGLWGKGRLLRGVRRADEAHILLKGGAIQGLSIGYREVKAEPDGQVRKLVELDLLEASLVSFPANRRARVAVVKSDRVDQLADRLKAGDLPSERVFEKGMRDAFGLTNAEAERAVRLFFKTAQGEPGTSANDTAAFLKALLPRG
jgi:HK97 family phage prohead protease